MLSGTDEPPLTGVAAGAARVNRQLGIFILGLALFLTGASFHLFTASLPLYLAGLGFDATTIGLLISTAAIAELIVAFGVGPSIDRFGAQRVFLLGALSYLLAAIGYAVFTVIPALALVRLLQGAGISAISPAGYSYIPKLVPARRQMVAFASLGVAGNLSMAICPPLGIALLESVGPLALFAASGIAAILGALVGSTVPAPNPSHRPFALTFRRSWLPPVLVNGAVVCQWGVITAFLPLVARDADLNPALLFTADALAVLATRIPAGWIADRFGPFRLVLVGLALTITADVLLLLPLSEPLLIISGVFNGVGGALVLPPLLAQLSRRSEDSTRGTALSYFNVSLALGLVLGAGGGGLLYPYLQLSGLLVVSAMLCLLVVVVAIRDPLLRTPTRPPAVAPA